MIAAIGADRGAILTLDATTLRTLYEAHRDEAGDQAKGLAAFALNLAGRPDHGSVVASKTELAERMADLILEDLRHHDADEVSSRRPIASILISVFRVTSEARSSAEWDESKQMRELVSRVREGLGQVPT